MRVFVRGNGRSAYDSITEVLALAGPEAERSNSVSSANLH